MIKIKTVLTCTGISAIIFFALFALTVFKTEAVPEGNNQDKTQHLRADIINFDSLSALGKPSKPVPLFLHDKHTDSLGKKIKDCQICHKSKNGSMSLKFMGIEDDRKEDLISIYCDNCKNCHEKLISLGKDSGPVKCDDCHQERPQIISSRVSGGFDKSLHYRHLKGGKDKCGLCHHEYDKENKKLIYAKGKEGTCRYCHKQETENLDGEKRIPMRQAAHYACISCHQEKISKNMSAGPTFCGGCHDPVERKKIKTIENVPRMDKNQPDICLIKTGDNGDSKTKMYRVPFDHKEHEKYNETCHVCHHADLKSCADCHSLIGKKEGNYINLKDSMHQLKIKHSCIGCHESGLDRKECAGCHQFIDKERKKNIVSCMKCHIAPPKESTGVLYGKGEMQIARMMPEIWHSIFDIDNLINIPDKIIIKELSDRYEPVEFPHQKIFQSLKHRIKNNRIAGYFHPVETTLCQGCHHNSPSMGKPPVCGSCHGKVFNETNYFMPRLKGAYHRQCMGCHDKMGIEKPADTDCTGCHAEKKNKQPG